MLGLSLRRCAVLLAFGLLPFCARAGDADIPLDIKARLEQAPIVRAEFVQSKQMAAMKRPLVTSGRLLVSREDGVLWQIERPYRATYALSGDALAEIGSDGLRRVKTAREMPGLSQVGRIFRALLAGDMASLGEYFELRANRQKTGWELVLTPRQAQLAQYLKELRLSGRDFVENVRLEEAGGDVTRIQFRNSRRGDALQAEERRLLTGH